MAIAAARLRWCRRARNCRRSNKVDLSSDNLTRGGIRFHTGSINPWGIFSMGSLVRLQPGLGYQGIE